jgi:hypothetical protein
VVQEDIVKFGWFESVVFGVDFANKGLLDSGLPVNSGRIDLFEFG